MINPQLEKQKSFSHSNFNPLQRHIQEISKNSDENKIQSLLIATINVINSTKILIQCQNFYRQFLVAFLKKVGSMRSFILVVSFISTFLISQASSWANGSCAKPTRSIYNHRMVGYMFRSVAKTWVLRKRPTKKDCYQLAYSMGMGLILPRSKAQRFYKQCPNMKSSQKAALFALNAFLKGVKKGRLNKSKCFAMKQYSILFTYLRDSIRKKVKHQRQEVAMFNRLLKVLKSKKLDGKREAYRCGGSTWSTYREDINDTI